MIAAELVETGARKDRRGRRWARRDEVLAAIAAYERSGLSQRAFAEREGIKFFTFTGWLRRHRAKPGFVEVGMARSALRSELVVALPSGVTVRGTDAAALADLVKRLGC